MLGRVIDLSLRYRVAVFVAAGLLVLVGLASLAELPFDAFPDTTPVQVTVNAVAPSLSPLEVERQITFPMEQAIGGLPGLEQVRSLSKFGFSHITAIFDDSTDVYLARQVVMERLYAVELPPGVEGPSLGPRLHRSRGGLPVRAAQRRADGDGAEDTAPLGRTAADAAGAGRRRDQHLGRLREAVPRRDRPDLLVKFELDARRPGRGGCGATTPTRAAASSTVAARPRAIQGVGPGDRHRGHSTRSSSRPATACRSSSATWRASRRDTRFRRGAVTAQGRGEAVLGLGFMLIGENSRELTRRLEERLDEVRFKPAAGGRDRDRLQPEPIS